MLCLSKPIHILPSTTRVPGVLRRSRLLQQLHQQPLHPQASGLRLNDTTIAFLVIQPAEGRSQVFLANSIVNLLLHILLVLSLCNSNTDCQVYSSKQKRGDNSKETGLILLLALVHQHNYQQELAAATLETTNKREIHQPNKSPS